MGSFISADPSGLGADANPYRYVGNSPTNATDPSGLGPCGGSCQCGCNSADGSGQTICLTSCYDGEDSDGDGPAEGPPDYGVHAVAGGAGQGIPGVGPGVNAYQSPAWNATKAGLYSFFLSGPWNILKGAGNVAFQTGYYARDVVAVGADAGVSTAGTLTGHHWSLGVQEWSQVGITNQPSNPNFASNAVWNVGRAGLAGGTLGSSEIVAGTWNYIQTGDAEAFQQHMGGVAGANLMAIGTIKACQA